VRSPSKVTVKPTHSIGIKGYKAAQPKLTNSTPESPHSRAGNRPEQYNCCHKLCEAILSIVSVKFVSKDVYIVNILQ
jgi:hypothetical protein